MNSNLNKTMRWAVIFAFVITGCSTTDSGKKLCAPPKLPPVDWIMVSGTSLPASTVVIGECGLTLADSLVVSGMIQKLDYQVEVASKLTVDSKLSDSQGAELQSILSKGAANAVSFDATVSDVASFLRSHSWMDIPGDWYLGFPESAFDKDLGTKRDRQSIASQIKELEPRLQVEAMKHFQVLVDSSEAPGSVSAADSSEYLRMLAREGRLMVSDYQKLKSWCFAHQKKGNALKGIADSFASKRSASPVMGEAPAKDTMMVLVHRGARCVVIPLPLVFETAFGGYWVEPGDHLFLARFGELPFRSPMDDSDELKQVAITGMVSTQGVWPTETRSLESVISSFREEIDLRANMIEVAQVRNNIVFQCMLPFNMTSLSPGRSTQMETLIREWGLVDGQVVSFQNSGGSPLLVNSTRKLRRATDIHRRWMVDNGRLCQHDQAIDSPCGPVEPDYSKNVSSRFEIASDACQTLQDSFSSVRKASSDMLGNLPLPGN